MRLRISVYIKRSFNATNRAYVMFYVNSYEIQTTKYNTSNMCMATTKIAI